MAPMTSSVQDADDTVVIRRAVGADAEPLQRLAQLDSALPLRDPVLVAETGGTPRAARSLADGRTIADPFSPTVALLALLEARAALLLHSDTQGGGRRAALRRRLPARLAIR